MKSIKQSSISRRTFVKGAIATGVIAAGTIPLSANTTMKQTTKSSELSGTEFFLTIEKTICNYTGKPAIATTVNGMLPAPTLKWKEGDEVTLHVTNKQDVEASIHWHGIILPNPMDGVPGLTFDGIKPGATFTYKFTVQQSGTYWYHSHSGFQEQTGLHGTIVIEPKEKEPYKFDKDYVIGLSDWSDEKPENIYRKLKVNGDYYNRNQRTLGDFFGEVKEKGFANAFNSRKMWNDMAMTDRDLSDVTGATYTYLMNGYNPASNFTALFKKGDKVKLRFVNSSAMTFFDVRIPGLEMTVVAADGNYVEPVTVDEFRIGVAETYDVIVKPKKDMAYAIFAQSLERSGYALGHLTTSTSKLASVPAMDPLPILSHADMGMNMAAMNMPGMDMGKDKSSNNDMSGMKGMNNSDMKMGGMKGMNNSDMKMDGMKSMNNSDMKMGGMKGMNMSGMKMDMDDDSFETKKIIPITTLEHKSGPQSTMKAMDPQYRLSDPGVGLRNNGRTVLTYADLVSIGNTDEDRYPEREIILHLTGNMERYMWSINGIPFSDAKPLDFKYGERLRITFVNDTMMNHPMHLHGLWSDLETGDGQLVRKHTIIVQPGSKISTRVTVDAKGNWAFHCHLLYHMLGMFRKVVVA